MQKNQVATSRDSFLQLHVIGIEQRQMRLFWFINASILAVVMLGSAISLRRVTYSETTTVLISYFLVPTVVVFGLSAACCVEVALATWCLVTRSGITIIRAFRPEWVESIPKADITRIDKTDEPDRIEILYTSGSVSLGPWSTKSMIPDRWYRKQRARLVGYLDQDER